MDLYANPTITDFQQDVNGDIKMLKIGVKKEDAYANIQGQVTGKVENNKTATINVSTYTQPVEITPTSSKTSMKKATVTLSNIPVGTGYDFTDDARNTFTLFELEKTGGTDCKFLFVLNGLAINDLSNLTESAKAYLINSGDPVTEGSIAISGTDITVTLTLGGSTVTYTGTTSATGTEVEGLIALIGSERYS